MSYLWFKIFNLTEFEEENLISKSYTLDLENIGEKTFLVTKGNYTSILVDGVFLSLNMSEENPFEFDSHAIYIDEDSQDVFVGFPLAN